MNSRICHFHVADYLRPCVLLTCSVAVLWIGVGQVFPECSGCSVGTQQVQELALSSTVQLLLSNTVVTHKVSTFSLHINSLSEHFFSLRTFHCKQSVGEIVLILFSLIHIYKQPSLTRVTVFSYTEDKKTAWKLQLASSAQCRVGQVLCHCMCQETNSDVYTCYKCTGRNSEELAWYARLLCGRLSLTRKTQCPLWCFKPLQFSKQGCRQVSPH